MRDLGTRCRDLELDGLDFVWNLVLGIWSLIEGGPLSLASPLSFALQASESNAGCPVVLTGVTKNFNTQISKVIM